MATAARFDSAWGLTVFARVRAASCLLAVALLAAVHDPASCDEGALVRRSGHRAVRLTAAAARVGFEIPDVLIVAGSDSLSAWGSPLLRGGDYSVDPGTRTLRLLSALPDTTRLVLRYTCLPLGLAPVYRHARAETLTSLPPGFPQGPALVEDTGAARAAEPLGSGLRVGGAKTFGITVGSDRDLSLEQSLRMSVSGNITDDVAVNAYLSDQNTPLVPEGDTEELRALDKVLIELTGERMAATMGDYELAIDGGALATVRRELSGAKVSADVGPGSVLLAGARLRGEFTSITFAGIGGKQGPYLLTDRSGVAGVVVVAGSERVWLDGDGPLVRGRDRDYVVDYATGEIEFTERRPVSSDNEITVDYEYALGDYGRDIYGGRGVLPLLGGTASVGASFVREVDDRAAREGVALSEEDVAILEAAGDDPSLAHDDGVELVGAGEGDYVLAGEGVFEYAGADSGDYDLSFERAGAGDYEYDYVRGAYVYAGPGEGDYRLGRSLPMPVDRGLVAADARFALPGGGSIVAEGAVSSLDRNTFSSLDDGDNVGNAELVSARLPAIGIGSDGAAELALGVAARRVGGNFEGVGRFRELRYEEKWELQGLELPAEEALAEGTAALTLGGGGRFDLSYGRLERGDALGSSKAEFSVNARPTGRSRAWANGRFVDLDYAAGDSTLGRQRTFYRGGVEHAIGFLVPSAVYAHDERSTDRRGERYDEYGAALASSGSEDLSFRAAYSHRLTDRSNGDSWTRASTTRTQEYALGLSGSERLTVDASVLRRAIGFEAGLDEPGSRYDLASLRLGHRSFEGAVSGEARYTVTATEIEEKERYVTVVDGVEVTRVVSTGRYVPVTDVSAGMRWNVAFRSSGGRALPDASALRRHLSGVSFETDVKLREMSTTDDRRRLYLLSPDVIQGQETVTGEISARHVARYAAPGGRLSVRLSLESRDELDRSYSNSSDARKERAGTVDVKLARGRSVVYRVQADLASRDQRASGAGSSYDIREGALLAEVTASAGVDLELRLTGSVGRQDERRSDAGVTIVRVTPSATYRLKGRGALSLSVTRAEVGSSIDVLPSYLGQGNSPGTTSEWRLLGDYRLNRYLTSSVSYTGEARPDAVTRHTLDMRVNAYF
jgi:hypothetical protein